MPPRQLLKKPEQAPTISSELQKRYDEVALAEQAKLPEWKQLLIKAIEGIQKGLTGDIPTEEGWGAARTSQLGTELLLAGLPFSAITKGKPVFHGTKKVFDKFSDEYLDTGDRLGSFIHFAENPKYADAYAKGIAKMVRGENPNIIPANIEAKNTLDITQIPNTQDMEAVLASVPSDMRKTLIQAYRQGNIKDLEGLITTHYNTNPNSFRRTPFDAIRYTDTTGLGYLKEGIKDFEKSWAVPKETPIKTPWGLPLSDDPIDINVRQVQDSLGHTLERVPTGKMEGPLHKFYSVPKEAQTLLDSELEMFKQLKSKLNLKSDMLDKIGTIKLTADEIDDLHFAKAITLAEKHYLYENNLAQPSIKNKVIQMFGGK